MNEPTTDTEKTRADYVRWRRKAFERGTKAFRGGSFCSATVHSRFAVVRGIPQWYNCISRRAFVYLCATIVNIFGFWHFALGFCVLCWFSSLIVLNA